MLSVEKLKSFLPNLSTLSMVLLSPPTPKSHKNTPKRRQSSTCPGVLNSTMAVVGVVFLTNFTLPNYTKEQNYMKDIFKNELAMISE